MSGSYITRTSMNDHYHFAFIHTSKHPTVLLCFQTWFTWSWFWKLYMVGHGNEGERTWLETVRKLGNIKAKLLYGSKCSKLRAEHTGMWQQFILYCFENMCWSGSQIETPESFWMQLNIHTNDILAVNNDYNYVYTAIDQTTTVRTCLR
jgi:hypothetical protein